MKITQRQKDSHSKKIWLEQYRNSCHISFFSFFYLRLSKSNYFKIYLLMMLLQLSHFPPFIPLHPEHPLPPWFLLFSLCPWVIYISSLASTFPILFLNSPCLFSTYPLCYLFSVPFAPLSLAHSPADKPPCDLHFCDSAAVLVVCLVCFCIFFYFLFRFSR